MSENKKQIGATVYNHERNPHSFDLGPIEKDIPSVRKRIFFERAMLEDHRVIPSETVVQPAEWAKLKAMPQFIALCSNQMTKDGVTKPHSARMSYKLREFR